jgi:hypothetical protein
VHPISPFFDVSIEATPQPHGRGALRYPPQSPAVLRPGVSFPVDGVGKLSHKGKRGQAVFFPKSDRVQTAQNPTVHGSWLPLRVLVDGHLEKLGAERVLAHAYENEEEHNSNEEKKVLPNIAGRILSHEEGKLSATNADH